MRFGNGHTADGQYIPAIRGHVVDSEIGMAFIGGTDDDSGTKPIVNFSAKHFIAGSGSNVTTRPLFQFRNHHNHI